MELKNYPILKEQQYETASQRIAILAEALSNGQLPTDRNDSKELHVITREVIQFLKNLI